LLNHQFVRFLLVGVLNTLFGYGCYFVLLQFGLHYTVAMALATVIGVLFNFKSTGALVFGSRDNRLVFRFVGSYVVVYLANISGIALLVRGGLSPQLAGAAMLLPMAVLAFVLNKKFVFTTP
jgi:putative flippase GtrA